MLTKKSPETTDLQKTIDDLLEQMRMTGPDSKEYATMADQVCKLYKLKEIDSPKRISPDTVAIIAGNIVGILLIIHHERANVVTSKALGFVMKPR